MVIDDEHLAPMAERLLAEDAFGRNDFKGYRRKEHACYENLLVFPKYLDGGHFVRYSPKLYCRLCTATNGRDMLDPHAPT